MQTKTKDTLQVDRVNELSHKLVGLSPEKLNMVLTMCNFFIDGMIAQERLESERESA